MPTKKSKSLNGLVFEIAYKRLQLSPTERIVFQRLLGFLIRNGKPFPYSNVSLAEITGFDKRTIVRALDKLEQYRLIERIGFTTYRKFKRGSILNRILSLATLRIKKEQYNNSTLATLCRKNLNTSDIGSSNKTSLLLKLKERDKISNQKLMGYQEYVGCIKSELRLGLTKKETIILSIEEWLLVEQEKNI